MTFNGMSSNTDISATARADVQDLQRHLQTADRRPSALQEQVVLLCSNYDGFCTNCEAILMFFSQFIRITVRLCFFLGGSTWECHDVSDILTAIRDIKTQRHQDSKISKYYSSSPTGFDMGCHIFGKDIVSLQHVLKRSYSDMSQTGIELSAPEGVAPRWQKCFTVQFTL